MKIELIFSSTRQNVIKLLSISTKFGRACRGKDPIVSDISFQLTKGLVVFIKLAMGSYHNSEFRIEGNALYRAMVNRQDWYVRLFGSYNVCYKQHEYILANKLEVVVYLDGVLVDKEEILNLWDLFFKEAFPEDQVVDSVSLAGDRRWFLNEIKREVIFGLKNTPIFNPYKFKDGIASISNECFYRYLGGKIPPTSELEQQIVNRSLSFYQNGPLEKLVRIGAGPGAVTLKAIIENANANGAYIEMVSDIPYAQTLLDDDSHGLDGLVLDISSFALFQSRKSLYRPLCLVPATSNALVEPISERTRGDVMTLEDVSSASFYLNQTSKLTKAKSVGFGDFLSNLETPLYTFWPFSAVFQRASNGTVIQRSIWEYDLVLLLVHESILNNVKLSASIIFTIRNSWMDLLGEPNLLHHALRGLVEDKLYLRSLMRTSGFYSLVTLKTTNMGTLLT